VLFRPLVPSDPATCGRRNAFKLAVLSLCHVKLKSELQLGDPTAPARADTSICLELFPCPRRYCSHLLRFSIPFDPHRCSYLFDIPLLVAHPTLCSKYDPAHISSRPHSFLRFGLNTIIVELAAYQINLARSSPEPKVVRSQLKFCAPLRASHCRPTAFVRQRQNTRAESL